MNGSPAGLKENGYGEELEGYIMTWEPFRNLVSLDWDKMSSESEIRAFQEHRDRCSPCRRYYEEITYVNRLFRGGEDEEVPPEIGERIRQVIKSL